ncbi:MAG: SPOR domain-containing protein [Acetobacteraceae bacterium]|jgi:hypothetical protein
MPEQVHFSGPMYRPSHDDYHGVDAGTKRILYLMGAGGLAILLGFGAYRVIGHSGGGVVPVIQAEQGPLRVKPENPGGMAVTPEAKPVDFADSHLAPPTEEPNPAALMAIGGPAKGPKLPVAALAPPRPKPFTVQISTAKSEADAQLDWDKLAKKLPDLFRDRRALFQKTDEHGPTPWRLRTGGFADAAQAKAFCDKVKAKGGQCSLVDS